MRLFPPRLFSALLVCLLALAACSHSPPPQPSTAKATDPWRPDPDSGLSMFRARSETTALLFLGTQHNFDPTHRQHAEIERLFALFKPTLVLIEGGVWSVEATRDQAIRDGGEMALSAFLAARAGVPRKSWEPTDKAVLAYLCARYDAASVKTLLVARLVPQYKADIRAAQIADRIQAALKAPANQCVRSPGSDPVSPPRDLAEFETTLRALVPGLVRWQDVTYGHTHPSPPTVSGTGLLNHIAATAAEVRDDELVRLTNLALKNHERVFLIAGAAHMSNTMPRFVVD